jgi:hypothetical protein
MPTSSSAQEMESGGAPNPHQRGDACEESELQEKKSTSQNPQMKSNETLMGLQIRGRDSQEREEHQK